MPVRWSMSIAMLLLFGCMAPRTPTKKVMTPTTAAVSHGWEGNANLALEQITPVPHLIASTAQSATRPSVDSLALYAAAHDATLRGDFPSAIGLLERAIPLDPDRFELLFDLGWAYVNAGNQDINAISAFEKAARAQPDNLDLQTELGRLYLAQSKDAEALNHLRLATQTSDYALDDGKAAVADYFLGTTLKNAGYDRAALKQYSIVVTRLEHPSIALQQNADLAYVLDRPGSLFVEIGEVLEKHGDYAGAVRSFQSAVDHQPDNFPLQARYARDLALDGQRDPALEKAIDLIVRNHATPASLAVLRDVCKTLNMPDGDVRLLKQLNADRPDDRNILFALTDTFIAKNRDNDARQLLESALQKSPADVPLMRRLFTMDKSAHRVSAAAGLLIHAFEANPDASSNYSPLLIELTQPGVVNRLTLAGLMQLQVPLDDEPARQCFEAMLAAKRGRPLVRRDSLRNATLLKPPFAPAFRALLNLDWDRSDWSDAQKKAAADVLVKTSRDNGDPALACELAGRALLRQSKFSSAVDQFAQSVRLGGRSAELILAGAGASRQPGRDPKYEQMLWALVSDRPWFEDGYIALSDYYKTIDPPATEQAGKVLGAWLTNDPQNVEARLMQAEIDLQDGQSRDAEQKIARLNADDPDDPEVFQLLSRFYSQTDRLNALIGQLEQQRSARPRDADLVGRLVQLYMQQQRSAEASRLIDATRAAVADDADLLYALSKLYLQINQKQTANEVLQQVLTLDPNHAGACNDLGFSLADQGKMLPYAESLVRTAVKAEPDSESFLDSLGWILYKEGNFDQARNYLQQAVDPGPSPDPVILNHLGDALYRLQRADDARIAWERSLKGVGDGNESREDARQLRLQLQQKLQQVDARKPVDVSPLSEPVITTGQKPDGRQSNFALH